MTLRRSLATALVAATALTALSAPAAAQRVDRVISFGDSLADTGIALKILKPQLPASDPVNLIYPSNRFNNGLNFVDIYAAYEGAPIVNYAVGGALTGTANTITGLPGFTQQWNAFRAGGVAPFPTNSGFAANDMVLLSIGGNDANVYVRTGGTLANAATAGGAAATQAGAGVNALVAAGAPAISFIASDTSVAPIYNGNAAGAAVSAAFYSGFNAGMKTVLGNAAAQGVIVNYLDGQQLYRQIAANPAAYGISPGQCTAIPGCVSSTANGFFFYVDGLHPSEGAARIAASYLWRMTQAPLGLGAPSEAAHLTARSFGQMLTDHMDTAAPRDGESEEGLNFFVKGNTSSLSRGATATADPTRLSATGVTMGVGYGFGTGTVGIAGNYSRPKATVGASHGDKATSLQAGIYGSVAVGPLFGQAYGLYGKDSHDLTRTGVIDTLSASVDGDHWGAGAKAGYLMGVGAMRVGPVVAIDYAKASVDAYGETGDALLALNVDETSRKALVGLLGLEARGDFELQGMSVRPVVTLGAEKELGGEGEEIRYSQQIATQIVNRYHTEEPSSSVYARLTGGASARLSDRIALDASATTTIGRDGGNEAGGTVGLSVAF